ncbi:protein Shroom2 isoform X1 [Bufo gargarizans]|uniref:protein Shroom2 isoform X1 n=1 Tax=Bufo gargarizans TaxID=30331 RepID=UPI001CF42151|nr:protein Shroom2 isoform X1 [Bufo gargarizans]
MENLESRAGHERFLPDDTRAHPGMVDHGQTMTMERKLVEGYRLVDVFLTGGAPWGFTLKGGKEHGELLIITKVEEGSKAAETLMAGDEMVNINDIPLSGYRQEAICLVKGSHKTLKMVVKRKNDIAYRPHSWHSTKFIENPMETLTAQLANSNLNPTWGNAYHSSSSSHDLTNSWDQTNLHRTSGHFSSMGSMDSIDQTYHFGRLSSAKSNNSIDNIGNHSKRDSAYGSFSTSFITPEHALPKSGSVSTENILYKINEWDSTIQGHGKSGQYLHETKGAEDKHVYPSSSETNKSQRVDDIGDTKHSGRSSFGPVWHVPDKKKNSSSPPPPPPPLRSDSYAIAKTHEKPPHTHSELPGTQHFNVANKSHSRLEWNSDPPDYHPQRYFRGPDRNISDVRRISNSSYQSEINLDQIVSYQEKYQNMSPHSNRLQLSQSTTDIRFAQPSYNYHHQRQYSDQSTFFPNSKAPASIKAQPQQVTFHSGSHELMADPTHVYSTHQSRIPSSSEVNIGLKVKGDNTGHSRVSNTGTKLPPQGSITHQYREDYSKVDASDRRSTSQESTALKTNYCLPLQNNQPSPENCEKYSPKTTGKKDSHVSSNERMKPRKCSDYYEGQYDNSHNVAQHDLTNRAISNSKYRPHQKDYSWSEEEDSKITPQITPMLHSLAQEGRNRSVSSPDTEASKQSRRSDRFATTLRNEIQQRRARLQKSKSTATLTESNDGEILENWNQDSLESINPPSNGSFSNTYKNHLKEAQARVLRATSFKRRDLEPSLADPSLSPERRNQGYIISKPMLPPDGSSYQFDNIQPKQSTAVTNTQNISRIGGRKRFTTQQKLKSYSEPEKINEVGIYEDHPPLQNQDATQGTVGSFADRWKFFEETSKSTEPPSSPKPPPFNVSGENLHVKYDMYIVKDYGKLPVESWNEKRSRAASLGFENLSEKDRNHKDEYYGVSSKSTDDIAPQALRLGTFAEYQASWKEQKKPLERKNSGRCHSADNILDADFDQSQKSQYMHERSRSSPTADFYTQGAVVESTKQAATERENAEREDCSREDSSVSFLSLHTVSPASEQLCDLSEPLRIVEFEDKGYQASVDESIAYESNRKVPNESPEVPDTLSVPQQSRARSGTLPSDYRFVNENVRLKSKDTRYSAVPISESQPDTRYSSQLGEEYRKEDPVPVNKKRGPAPQRPPPPKLDKYWRQNGSTSSLATSTESLLTPSHGTSTSYSPGSVDVVKLQASPAHSPGTPSDKHLNVLLHNRRISGSSENVSQHLDKKQNSSETEVSSKSCYLQKPGMERSRSPSPQFAPQKLTDKPPLLVQDESLARIERVIDNTTIKMVPIKIVHSESHAEKESRNNLLSAIEPPALPTGLTKDQIKTLSTSEQSYSRFCAYTRLDHDPEDQPSETNTQSVQEFVENASPDPSLTAGNSKGKDLIYADLKSEELMREIVGKDKSLADILDPNAKMMTTMDLMEGIFRKDEHLLEEAQQRRKMNPKVPSPRPSDEKKEDPNKAAAAAAAAISLTTSSTYYSTSAPKAELLIKMKDMQEHQHNEESSEDELDHNLFEKKQELIDSISKKLQVLREARETLLEDIQCNNALGEEVEIIVKEVCKPNEFDKFRMFIGDLEKIVNLLLSLSGRLARVENALNNLDEKASSEERRTLVEKRKLLTRQHEDAKELKENLDRRERTVFDILASYLNEENLADYEHFVKMKSALILEQRELEDKIKLGEEQLKCLTDSLPPDRTK